MNARRKGPGVEDWLRWLDGEMPEEQGELLRQRLQEDKASQQLVAVLRSFRKGNALGKWPTPPEKVRRRVLTPPAIRPLVPPPVDAQAVPLLPPDVRGAGPLAVGDSVLMSRSLAEGDVSLMVTPPGDDDLWHLEGRVWLATPSPSTPLLAALAQDDHVLTSTEFHDGEMFELSEMMGPGWTLEIHLPQNRCWRIQDPGRSEDAVP